MTPGEFSYARPAGLDEAMALLTDGPGNRLLAGGQSLIPLLSRRAVRPRRVIDINRLPGLDRIEMEGQYIRMGALVRQEQARGHPLVREEVCGLAEALSWVASPVIRERGTLIGNLVTNAPGSELPAVAIALGAWFTVRDRLAERRVEARELLDGRVLAPDLLVTHVLWPRAPGRGGFYEVARRHGHAPVVGAMVRVSREDCRVGLCGVAAVGIACRGVATAIWRRFPGVPDAQEIAELLEHDLIVPPFGDAFVVADYRREVAPEVIRRAVAAAVRSGTH